MKLKKIYVKLTDNYIYVYSNKVLKKYESKYIKNGKVDNPYKLINYLNRLLNNNIFKKKYIFILDTLLCNSDIFVYKYVFENMGLLNYKIISDIDIVKSHLNDENIIIMNWSSSIHYCYINNHEIVINKFNSKIIDNLKKKYVLICGDYPLDLKIKTPIFYYEDKSNILFSFLEES